MGWIVFLLQDTGGGGAGLHHRDDADATNALLVTFLAPVSALGPGMVVLGERLSPLQLAGMALIFADLATLDGRLLRLLRRSTRYA